MAVKQTQLSINSAIQAGWEATSHYMGFYITLVFLLVLFNLVPSLIDGIYTTSNWYAPVIRGIFIILIALVTLGMIRTTIKSVDRKEPTVVELFHLHLFARYVIASVAYLAIFVGGLALFVVPGIYWGLKYQFATYLVIDRRMKIGKAFEESAKLVRGHEWDLFAYWLVMFLLNLVGLLFFAVGIVITLPVTIVGYSYLYRQLCDNHYQQVPAKKRKK